jgi:chromosome segregation ATPase
MIQSICLRNWKGLTGTFSFPGPITALIGQNGSGKTAILEAIQVGLTGYTALGKLPKAVLSLASDKVAEITIEDSAGNLLTRKFERSGSGGKQTITLNGEPVMEKDLVLPPEMRIPVEGVHPGEFLAMSGDKRAEWLFRAIGDDVTKVEPGQFPASPEWFTEPMAANDLVEKIKAEVKTTKNELDRNIALIQKLTGDAGNLPAGTRNEWETKLVESEKEYTSAVQAQAGNAERLKLAGSKAEHRNRLAANIKNCEDKIATTGQQIKSLQAAIQGFPSGPLVVDIPEARKEYMVCLGTASEARSRVKELRHRIELMSKGHCPTCGTPAANLSGAIDEWDMEATALELDAEDSEAKAKELTEAINRAEKITLANEKRTSINNEIRVYQDALKAYRSSLEKYQAEQADLDKDTGDSEANAPEILAARVDGAKTRRDEARQAVDAFKAVEATRGARSKAESDRQKLEQQLADLKDLQKEVKAYADKALDGLTAKISGPLQTATMAAFGEPAFLEIIGANGKPTVDFGIKSGSFRISFDTMSGGERCVILAALVASLQLATIGRPRLLLAELAEADQKRMAAVVTAIRAIGFEQAILATCHDEAISPESDIEFLVMKKKAEEVSL